MSTHTDSRTRAMGNGTATGVVESCSHVTQERASAYGCLPGRVVHAKLLEVGHVDGQNSIRAAQPY